MKKKQSINVIFKLQKNFFHKRKEEELLTENKLTNVWSKQNGKKFNQEKEQNW